MKQITLNQMEGIEGGKFWGTDKRCSAMYAYNAFGDKIQTGNLCCSYDYMFWIRVSRGYGCETYNIA